MTESYIDEAAFDFANIRCGKCDGKIKHGDLIRKTPEGWDHAWHDEKRTPAEWLATDYSGIVIRDPDGWREDGKSMDEPISKDEFSRRLAICTLSGDIDARSF